MVYTVLNTKFNAENIMSHVNSVQLTKITDFRKAYRLIKKHKLLKTTPIILSEGDSWFSTPLSMNLIDQLVFPLPDDITNQKVIFGKGGLFYRAEKSGDTAMNMFTPKRSKRLAKWIGSQQYKFDLVLLSAGGNDLVSTFLKELFENQPKMSVKQGIKLVVDSGQFEKVYQAYAVFIDHVRALNKDIPIIAHTYDYPQRMGKEGELTIANIGLIAFFKKRVGDWISKNIQHSIADINNQQEFAKQMIDKFEELVLMKLEDKYNNFSYIDLRGTLNDKKYWFDEMHPTGEGFYQLSRKLIQPIKQKLPANKRH